MVNGSAFLKDSAVLDTAHQGDIKGALGTVRIGDFAKRATWGTRLRTLLAIMGPGLIVMVGDNDAGGISTYAQAGQNYGTSLLWVLLLLIPVLIVCQEMAVRLGLVTGVGHARLIFERFGKFWGMFSVGDLFILNFLTIVTEFIGISMAMSYFGVSAYISVPVFALILILVTLTGSFRKWETFMFMCVAVNFIAIPLAFLSHPHIGPIVHDAFVPSVQGGLNSNAMLLIIGMVGTTVAPWQLFFQQSNVIDKRLTPRWMRYEQMDTTIGAFVVVIGAAALIIATAFAFHGTKVAGQFVDAATVAHLLSHAVGRVSGDLFAIALLNASIIGAGAVTLSTSYAFGDVFNMKHSLHRKWSDAKGFYSIYAGIVLVAAGIVLIPHAPLGLMTILVQVLAGVLLPSATAFLLLLCNDRAILGPWVNKAWQNVLGSVIVGVLTMLSLILAATTMFPQWNVNHIAEILAGVLIVGLVAVGVLQLRKRGTQKGTMQEEPEEMDRWTWRMSPLKDLPKTMPSRATAIGMLLLRSYLVIAVVLLVVKAIQITIGH